MDEKTLEQMLLEAAETKKQKELDAQKSNTITKEDLADFFNKFEQKIELRIQKAKEEIEVARGEGVGRKGTVTDPREDNPVSYLASKAKDPNKLTDDDKVLIGAITNQALISLFPENIKY